MAEAEARAGALPGEGRRWRRRRRCRGCLTGIAQWFRAMFLSMNRNGSWVGDLAL